MAAALVLVSVGVVGLIQHGPTSKSVPSYGYYESSDYILSDNLKPNLLYNQSTLTNPAVIYTGITSNISITDQFSLSMQNITNRSVYIENSATLTSGSPSWSKTIYVNTTTVTVGTSGVFNFTIPVNLQNALNMSNSIDKQLNVQGGAPNVMLNFTAVPSGLSPVREGMRLVLYGSYYYASYGNISSAGNTVFKKVSVSGDRILPLNTYEALIPLAIGAALALYLAIPYIPRGKDDLAKVKSEHGNEIVSINRPPSEDAILLEDPEYIFKMAEILEAPIFLYEWSKLVYLEHNGKEYYAELK